MRTAKQNRFRKYANHRALCTVPEAEDILQRGENFKSHSCNTFALGTTTWFRATKQFLAKKIGASIPLSLYNMYRLEFDIKRTVHRDIFLQ